jgi:hypothetical protein
MTLGRTSSGSIKIKTDGGLRAVSCACCGSVCENCGSLPPIAPPDDPDFLKKLRGDDPDVTPFTQVAIDYSVVVSTDGSDVSSAAGSAFFSWVEPAEGECWQGFGKVLRVISRTESCEYAGGCGSCVIFNFTGDPPGVAQFGVFLTESNCLFVSLYEDFQIEGFKLAVGLDLCTANTTSATITINGVSYPVIDDIIFEGNSVRGYMNVTFS